MVKKNLSRIDSQYCPCQKEEHGDDASWAGTALQRVRGRHYYEQKHKRERDDTPTMFSSGPIAPTTRRGTEITQENFPDCNYVCPVCEQEWLAVVDIYPADERGERPENTFTDDDWEVVEAALKRELGFRFPDDEDEVRDILEKVR